MKKYFAILIALSFISLSCKKSKSSDKSSANSVTTEAKSIVKDTTYFFEANTSEGFNFGYYIFVPKNLDETKINYLLVENTNTGFANDTLQVHIDRAKNSVSNNSMGNYIAKKMGTPFLMPVFPRPYTEWHYYTHAFDSDTFTAQGKDFENIDQQLNAMVENAKKQLENYGVELHQKFFLAGFSASGTFANRFAILHPDKIQAVAGGGLNGIAILPQDSLNGRRLNFPLGTANIENVTGNAIDFETFRSLPQFWFMGGKDTNDAVGYDDGYSEDERQLVYAEMNRKMMPDRWNFVRDIYEGQNINATFKTYENMGHGTDAKIKNDIIDFFKQNSEL